MLWKAEDPCSELHFKGHEDFISKLVILNNKSFAVSVSNDKTVRLWNLINANCEKIFKGHCMNINTLILTTNDRYALTADEGRFEAVVWDLEKRYRFTRFCYDFYSPESILIYKEKYLIVGTLIQAFCFRCERE